MHATFTQEEKIAAVTLVLEGRTPRSVANEYGVHENTIYKWRLEFETNPDDAFTLYAGQDGADEVSRLKRRDKELELEMEFLKNGSILRESPRYCTTTASVFTQAWATNHRSTSSSAHPTVLWLPNWPL